MLLLNILIMLAVFVTALYVIYAWHRDKLLAALTGTFAAIALLVVL